MTKAEVESTAHSAPVVIFSKTYCPYCSRVKDLFKTLNANTKVIELDTVANGAEIQQNLKEITGQSTVPNVWVGGKFIGGCDDTTRLHKAGNLVPALTAANAI